MVMWPEAVSKIGANTPTTLNLHQRRYVFTQRLPVVIMGSSGAGKTRIWSRMTGNSSPHEMSLSSDDGYLVYPKKSTVMLSTIPGQLSRSRYSDIAEAFGEESNLHGVIFVASYGFDHIWPSSADVVADMLPSFDLNGLRNRNIREELAAFDKVCDLITQKHELARNRAPKWLLTLVNKVDLFWDDIDGAANYYLPNHNSQFAERASMLVERLGSLNIKYRVLPVSTEPDSYRFSASQGVLTSPTHLDANQSATSISCLKAALEELCEL